MHAGYVLIFAFCKWRFLLIMEPSVIDVLVLQCVGRVFCGLSCLSFACLKCVMISRIFAENSTF